MKRHLRTLLAGTIVVALGATGLPAAAQHTDRRGGGGDSQGAAQPRGDGGNSGGSRQPDRGRSSDGGHRVESAPPPDSGGGGGGGARQRDSARPRDDSRQQDNARQQERDRQRQQQPDPRAYGNSNGRDQRNDGRDQRNDGRDARGGGYSSGSNNRRDNGRAVPPTRGYAQRRDPRDGSYYYGASRSYNPRTAPRDWVRPRIYGSGGHLSVYFGWGTGYRYGSPYYGRVYGYSAPVTVYGSARRYYGDVRLRVSPRWAEVYVDGYYAGVVDEFDGIFQRLTIEIGPHEIEVASPGYESQFFEIYVDPDRTIELRGDLYPLR